MAYSTTLPLYPRPAKDNRDTPIADQRLTVSTGVVSLAAYTQSAVNVVVLDVQDQDVMCTFDGSSPSAVNGHHLIAGEKYTWNVETAHVAKFIRQGGTDGVVHASPFSI